MKIETGRDELRLTARPVGEMIGAAGLIAISVLAATRLVPAGLPPEAHPWIRGAMFCLSMVGVLIFLAAERIDHRFRRARGAADLSWRSVVRGRGRSLPLTDIAAIVVEEDEHSDYGHPSRIVLALRNGSRVPLTEHYLSSRNGVVRASRELAQFLGVRYSPDDATS